MKMKKKTLYLIRKLKILLLMAFILDLILTVKNYRLSKQCKRYRADALEFFEENMRLNKLINDFDKTEEYKI